MITTTTAEFVSKQISSSARLEKWTSVNGHLRFTPLCPLGRMLPFCKFHLLRCVLLDPPEPLGIGRAGLWHFCVYVTFHRKKVLPTCGNLREFPQNSRDFPLLFPQNSRNFPLLFPQNSRNFPLLISRISRDFPQFPVSRNFPGFPAISRFSHPAISRKFLQFPVSRIFPGPVFPAISHKLPKPVIPIFICNISKPASNPKC